MAWPTSNFPTSLDTITDKSDTTDDVIAADINGAYDCIEKLEAKVGINSSAVNTSLDYLLKNTSSANPGHKHTLANSATDVTATAAELNALDGITATVAELNYCGGVTSAIQTQLNSIKYISLSGHKGLIIKTVVDHASVDIDADYVLMMDASGNLKMATAVNLTVDLDISAAINGRDAGVVAANQGWFLYVISNGTTTAGLASTSETAPTMPSGYTYKALVGWATTDNTATPFNIEEFTQIDDIYYWATAQLVYTGTLSTTTLAIDLKATGILGYQVVPSNAKEAIVRARSTTGAYLINPVTFSDSIGDDTPLIWSMTYLAGGAIGHMQSTKVPLIEAQTLYHQHTQTQATKTYISGFALKR